MKRRKQKTIFFITVQVDGVVADPWPLRPKKHLMTSHKQFSPLVFSPFHFATQQMIDNSRICAAGLKGFRTGEVINAGGNRT